MRFEISGEEIKRAQFPHNLFITGLLTFNLFGAPAVIALHIGMQGLLIPLICSVALVAFIRRKSKQKTSSFVDAHWRLALMNSRWLMLGYAITAGLILVAWLVSQTAHEDSMKHILWTALTRIGLLPTLVAVMVTAVLEASAISLAAKKEVPDKVPGATTAEIASRPFVKHYRRWTKNV
jgi:cytochrome bd-type quinol oxidase subunit 2